MSEKLPKLTPPFIFRIFILKQKSKYQSVTTHLSDGASPQSIHIKAMSHSLEDLDKYSSSIAAQATLLHGVTSVNPSIKPTDAENNSKGMWVLNSEYSFT